MMDQSLMQKAARQALQCLDLTSLNDGDTAADIAALCARAQTPFGPVAAVCVWPRFVAQARALLPANIRVAAVANFPAGDLDLARTLADVQEIATAGGDEVDVVLPYRALMQGQSVECAEFLAEVRHATRPLTLKVIIESGELLTTDLIAQGARLALMAGADFVKTSTGKTKLSATPKAATLILHEIAVSGFGSAGFKASGGIRTVADAQVYLQLVETHLGAAAIGPQRLRFGASALLGDIEAVLSGSPVAAAAGAY
ncbi:deoxyribose-phosphate aldolase [Roseateles oligotrophus]|uniref:Deoxyribose-phosphate aldolase n=1 Tax=Roseateles oligotrophus TaxID=1769250 RepID=A0ABT2YLK8_9BURK|nr:deoxyribose-phosphate aldolase [Roseateles oligotrophus]MCV2370934.1 deoxyribose-phosphate aldolase [Roseateles oligotrophus]